MEIQWTLVLFTVIAGAGAWLFASSACGELLKKDKTPGKTEAIVAFVLLVVGGFMSVLHLKHPDRILEALNRPTSGIFIEAALIGIMCLIIFIYFVMILRKSSPKARLVVAVIGMVVGIIFSYECGASYMMVARPDWMTIMLPLAYAGTAAAAGTGLNFLIKAAQKRESESVAFAAKLSLVGSIIGIVSAVAFCVASGADLFTAEHNLNIWAVALFAALVFACVCSAFAIKQSEKALPLAVVIVIGSLIAAIAVRVIMWLIGTPVMDFFLMPLE